MVNAPARKYHTQQTHFIRATVAYTDAGNVIPIGTIPNGAVIISSGSGAFVGTLFDSSGTDLMDIGYAAHTDASGAAVVADPNAYGSALVVSTAGQVPLDEAAATVVTDSDSGGIPVTATYTQSVADAANGTAEIIVQYVT